MNYETVTNLYDGDNLAQRFFEQQSSAVEKRRESRRKLRAYRRVVTEITVLCSAIAMWLAAGAISLYFVKESIILLCS